MIMNVRLAPLLPQAQQLFEHSAMALGRQRLVWLQQHGFAMPEPTVHHFRPKELTSV